MSTTQPRASRHHLGWRGRLAATLLALASTVGVATATAAPATAADGIIYCFQNNYGQPLDRELTRIEYYGIDGNWWTLAFDRTNSDGCSAINTTPWRNYYLRVSAAGVNDSLQGSTAYVGPGAGWYLRYGFAFLRYR